MNDPSNICLDTVGVDLQTRRDVYSLIHFANVIRKNILLIAPGIDTKGFINFIHGPTRITSNAMSVAISQLPKTITKSVVSDLGKYHVEGKNNIGYSTTFKRIFERNYDMESQAAEFFTKNLTTARCNEGIVFVMLQYLVFRYDLKRREKWFDRCRFIWIGCALFRLPVLLPVLAAQIFLYTIKIFIQQPSLTRKEELSILADLLRFLPGMATVAKPPFGTGLSVWYREMARHRRIVLEALLIEAKNDGDIRYYNAPYSMMNFECIEDVIVFISEELKYCEKQETMEKEKGRRRNTRKDPFVEETELDEEDRELLQLGGYRVECEEEIEEEEIVEEVEEEIVEEEVVGEDMNDDTEEYSEAYTQFVKNCRENIEDRIETPMGKVNSNGSDDPIPLDVSFDKHLQKKLSEDDGETGDRGRRRSIDSGYEEDGEVSPPKKSTGWNGIIYDNTVREESLEERVEEEEYEDAIRDIFDTVTDELTEEELVTDWDPSTVLSTQEIARGFQEAQMLLVGTSQTMGSSMDLHIPMTTETTENNDSISSDSLLSSIGEGEELRGDISPSTRSDDDERDEESGGDEWNGTKEDGTNVFMDQHQPAPHIRRAPMKTMREPEELIDEDEVDWVETIIIDCDEVEFIEEKIGPNGGKGPLRRVVKEEDVDKDAVHSQTDKIIKEEEGAGTGRVFVLRDDYPEDQVIALD